MDMPDESRILDATSRTRRMVGDEGMAKLASANVAVLGLGGVGSACAEALVRVGVGSLSFVDRDTVEPSNINRQALAFWSTVGMAKVDAMEKISLDINPQVRLAKLERFVTRENIGGVFDAIPRPDYVADAVDTLTCKVAIAKHCEEAKIPSIHSGGGANRFDPFALACDDLFSTEICPLCRELRKIARSENVSHMQMIYSREHPVSVVPAEGAERKEKTELGSLSYIPAAMGIAMASWIIRQILDA